MVFLFLQDLATCFLKVLKLLWFLAVNKMSKKIFRTVIYHSKLTKRHLILLQLSINT